MSGQRPIVIGGVDSNGDFKVASVNDLGQLSVTGGGGGGDASAANQVTQIGQLTDILNAIALIGTEATLANIETAIAALGTEATLVQVRDAIQSPTAPALEDAVMLNIPPLNLGAAGTIQSISFTDIVSLEFKPRSNTEIWYTFASDGFTTGAYEILEGVGQSYEYGQAGRKFTGTLYLQDPINDNTLVGFTGFF